LKRLKNQSKNPGVCSVVRDCSVCIDFSIITDAFAGDGGRVGIPVGERVILLGCAGNFVGTLEGTLVGIFVGIFVGINMGPGEFVGITIICLTGSATSWTGAT